VKYGQTLKVVTEELTLTDGLILKETYARFGIEVQLGSPIKVYQSKKISSSIVNGTSALCIVTGLKKGRGERV